jgi:4-alpha-glucanotransferase
MTTVSDNLWMKDNNEWKSLYTSAFQNAIFQRQDPSASKVKREVKKTNNTYINFQVSVPKLAPEHSVCILGSREELGEWNKNDFIPMNYKNNTMWEKVIKLNRCSNILHFKFGIFHTKTGRLVSLEHGDDRLIYNIDFIPKSTKTVEIKSNFKYSNNEIKAAGVAIPVFSLRSKTGMGVGEFTDIKLLVDWCAKTGLKMIQLLPVNDTIQKRTWEDSYPYSAISSFALHPIYLNIAAIDNLPKDITEKMLRESADILNKEDSLNYQEVMKIKTALCKKIFTANKEAFLKNKNFKKFFKNNSEWLIPYAAYSYLRDKFKTTDYRKWGLYSKYNEETIKKLVRSKADIHEEIAIYYFIQFHLDKQLREAANYARKNGIILKGDVPIGVNKYSVDTWTNPKMFNMDFQTGAPPDDYAEDGQNWGFPTYNWDEMEKDNYLWWQKRFSKMAEYFDAYRIDHILGFFRIWEIPNNAISGLLGYFSPAIPVTKNEFDNLNIDFNEKRFCKPYIRNYIYSKYGHETAELLKAKYLDEYAHGCYKLKEKYNTQEKIEIAFTLKKNSINEEKIKKILMQLSTEILFIKDKHKKNCYHPRISIEKTASFTELNGYERKKLHDIYVDYFYNRQDNLWKEEAYKKLPTLIRCTNMLVCGEDLGMVPDCVQEVMHNLGLLSLKIQRMPKDEKMDFGIPSQYPYMSVCTPSCHDMSTIRGWWEEDGKKRQNYYNNNLGHHGEAPVYCEPWICDQILEQHLHSPSMWAVFPIQDLMATNGKLRKELPKEEKINEPANSKHHWKYRFHIPIEDLLKEKAFNNHIREMIINSGREQITY